MDSGAGASISKIAPLPVRNGVSPSYAWLQAPEPCRALAWLQTRFPDVTTDIWPPRMARGEVVAGAGAAIAPDTLLQRGMRVWYYREIEAEPRMPFDEVI
ncbi:MAG: pseudouridine synthase, partial [Bdellovibrionales bacterium]|nr:pseudouridine synthase [Massilia sp.]